MSPDTASARRPAAARAPSAPTARGAAAGPPSAHWWALPSLLAGTFLSVLDFFVVNVALADMQRDLHAGPATVEWVVAGYGLTFGVLLITAGRIADRLGRRRVFMVGLIVFALSSAGCGLAPDTVWLIACRLVQGAGCAAMSATVLAIIGVAFPGPARARAISLYGLSMGVAALGGQLIGGALIQADVAGLGWRVIFLINVPIAAFALAMLRFVPESRAPRAASLDVTGMLLSSLALTALTLPLIDGRQAGWPAWTWLTLAAVIPLLAMLAAQQRRRAAAGREPLLDPGLLRSRAFRIGVGVQLLYWCSQAPLYLVLALYLQSGRGLSPFDAGLIFLALAAGYLAVATPAPQLHQRWGARLVILGAAALTAGLLAAALVVHDVGVGGSAWWLIAPLTVIGLGIGACITPLTLTVLAHATPQQAGTVSGALGSAQQVGNTLGVALTGVIFFRVAHGSAASYASGFTVALLELAVLTLLVAICAPLLGRAARR